MIALEVHTPTAIFILRKTWHCGRVQGQPRQINAGAHHPLVMVWVDAYRVGLEVKTKLAVLDLLQLILVKVGPSPYAGVDHVRKSFPTSNLKSTIKCPLDSNAFSWMGAIGCYRSY
jgi:hypothetical protein